MLLTSMSGGFGTSIFPSDAARVLTVNEPTGHLSGHQLAWRFKRVLQSLDLRGVIVHDHGIWQAANHQIASFCHQRRIPRVVSPRGMLAAWSLKSKRWKKAIGWTLYQYQDLRRASGFHVTSEQEADEVRRLGFQQPIAVVPNGIDFPATLPARSPTESRRVLFLSRINPKKGVECLLKSWAQLCPAKPWELLIVGPGDPAYIASLKSMCRALQISGQVHFRPESNETEKWQHYVDAEIFVLPSYNENFGNVIAEAMVAGLPVITTTGTPWRAIAEQELGWWVAPETQAVTRALSEAMKLKREELVQMGRRGRCYVLENFSWHNAARLMNDFYYQLRIELREP